MGAASGPEGSPPRVLVVDDNAGVRELFTLALRLDGCHVVEAGGGREALARARAGGFDAILLDSRMPDLDGRATLAQLRQLPATRLVPIIVVTGLDDVHDRVATLDAGATDYLVKPVDPDEVTARVRAHLRERAALRHSIEERLRARALVAEALGGLAPDRDPYRLAATVCGKLDELDEVRASVLVGLFGNARATVLAASGSTLQTGDELPAELAARLWNQAGGDGWIERRDRRHPDVASTLLFDFDAEAMAFAPLRTSGPLAVLGLVASGRDDPAPGMPARCLSTALDLAPVVAALLGPALNRHGTAEEQRRRIRRLLADDAHWPVFQPIVDLASGAVAGYEALTRFVDGTAPHTGFVEAHRLGLGNDLERATAASAVRAARQLPGGAWLSINVSPSFLTDHPALAGALHGTDRPLVLELTEHDPIDDYPTVQQALARLGGETYLSVDDAGAGYACLTHVLALRPRFVKLDRTWVSAIERDPARQALVAGLGTLAAETGSTLIAEGIERDVEQAALTHLRVRLGQGLHLGAPTPPTSTTAGSPGVG